MRRLFPILACLALAACASPARTRTTPSAEHYHRQDILVEPAAPPQSHKPAPPVQITVEFLGDPHAPSTAVPARVTDPAPHLPAGPEPARGPE